MIEPGWKAGTLFKRMVPDQNHFRLEKAVPITNRFFWIAVPQRLETDQAIKFD
jgi:hypothetical protein